MPEQSSKYRKLGARALHEFFVYWIVTIYLILLLGSFTLYRRLALMELGFDYLTYGFKLVEALLVGKLILIAQAIGLGRRYERNPLLFSIALKSLLFAIFIIACNVLEQAIRALLKGTDLVQALGSFADKGLDEILGRTLVLMITLVPLVAFLGVLSRLWLAGNPVTTSSRARRLRVSHLPEDQSIGRRGFLRNAAALCLATSPLRKLAAQDGTDAIALADGPRPLVRFPGKRELLLVTSRHRTPRLRSRSSMTASLRRMTPSTSATISPTFRLPSIRRPTV